MKSAKLLLQQELVDGHAYWVLRDALGVAALSMVREAVDPARRSKVPGHQDVGPSPVAQGLQQAGVGDSRRTSS